MYLIGYLVGSHEHVLYSKSMGFRRGQNRAVANPTQSGKGAKKFQVEPNIYHHFLSLKWNIGAKAQKKHKH